MDKEAPPPSDPVLAPPAKPAADDAPSFWIRGGAFTLDGIVVLAAVVLPALFLPEPLRSIAEFLVAGAYFTFVPVAFDGRTLGKMAAGLKVVRKDGSPLTHGRAFARWLGYMLSEVTLCLGFLCAAFTTNRRALHDYVAGTRVVKTEELGFGRKLAMVLLSVLLILLLLLGAVGAVMSMRALSDDEDVRTRLGSLRAGLTAYERDAPGSRPADLAALAPKYVQELGTPGLAAHPGAVGVESYGAEICSGSKEPGAALVPEKLRDTGRWGYVAAPGAPCDGAVFIDCTHADSSGVPWYAY